MNLSNLIKSKRIEKNMTMEELASFLGVNHATISRWESGNIKSIKTDKVPLLSKYLDIPIEKLLTKDSLDKFEKSVSNSINNFNNKMKKTKESVKFLKSHNFINSKIQNYIEDVNVNENLVKTSATLDQPPTNTKILKIVNIANNMTSEGQERLLEQAEFLLGRYKK